MLVQHGRRVAPGGLSDELAGRGAGQPGRQREEAALAQLDAVGRVIDTSRIRLTPGPDKPLKPKDEGWEWANRSRIS